MSAFISDGGFGYVCKINRDSFRFGWRWCVYVCVCVLFPSPLHCCFCECTAECPFAVRAPHTYEPVPVCVCVCLCPHICLCGRFPYPIHISNEPKCTDAIIVSSDHQNSCTKSNWKWQKHYILCWYRLSSECDCCCVCGPMELNYYICYFFFHIQYVGFCTVVACFICLHCWAQQSKCWLLTTSYQIHANEPILMCVVESTTAVTARFAIITDTANIVGVLSAHLVRINNESE